MRVWWNGRVDSPTPVAAALRALVPEMMAEHPGIAWRLDDDADGICILLHPEAAPERVARVGIRPGEEVYSVELGPHRGVTVEHVDAEKPDEARERIATAVSAVRGPSRLVLTYAGETQTRSELVLAPDSPEERSDGVHVHRPATELFWRLRRRRLRQEVLELGPVSPPAR